MLTKENVQQKKLKCIEISTNLIFRKIHDRKSYYQMCVRHLQDIFFCVQYIVIKNKYNVIKEI